MNQQIDWPGIRAAAVAIGVREAARRAAINLTPEESNRFVKRVLKRSEREGWVVQKKAALAQLPTEQQAIPLSSTVVNGSDSLESAIIEDGKATRKAFSKATRKFAEHVAKLKPSMAVARSIAVKNWTGVGSTVYNWGTGQLGGSINLNILTNQAAVQVNASHAK